MPVEGASPAQPPTRCFACGRQHVPDVSGAAWLHPYRFSGRVPARGLAITVGAGLAAALAAGIVGYFGGAITHWIGVQALDVSSVVATALADSGLLGDGASMAVLILPLVLVGVLWPTLIGGAAGGAIAWGAMTGAIRRPRILGPLGVLAGLLAYGVFLGTAVTMRAPLHESSRILEAIDPPFSYALMVIDLGIVVWTARWMARSRVDVPFCESCGTWFADARRTTIPIAAGTALLGTLASDSVESARGVPVDVGDAARIDLALSHCACDTGVYDLVAAVRWDALKQHRRGAGALERRWFETTISPSLGAAIEDWWAPRPKPTPLATAAA